MLCCPLFGIILLMVCSFCVAVTGIPFRTGNAQYWKIMCDGIDEVTDNSTCKYGVYKNPCGKVACLRGVAMDCDEPRSTFRFGKCAHGLFCMCERCQGCIKEECYSNLGCFNKLPFAKRMNNYPIEYNNYNEY